MRAMTTELEWAIEDLVAANRILSAEGVVDAYGHVSVRHPDNPARFLLSRARAPECIEAGDTDMLVSTMAMGRDLARGLGANPTALMRGHGCVAVAPSIREAVSVAVYLNVNAELQMKAAALGPVTFLSRGEVDKVNGGPRPYVGVERASEYSCLRALSLIHISEPTRQA